MPLNSLNLFQNICQKSHSNIASKIILMILQLTIQLVPPSISFKAMNWKIPQLQMATL